MYLARETARLEAALFAARARLEATKQSLASFEGELDTARADESTARARYELAVSSARPDRTTALRIATGWFFLGVSVMTGGGCFTAPIFMLAGRLGARDE